MSDELAAGAAPRHAGSPRAGLSRRQLLVRSGQAASAIGITSFLAACGISGTSPSTSPGPAATAAATPAPTAAPSSAPTPAPTTSTAPTATPAPTPAATPAGVLEFANWPLYIDTDDENESKHQTLLDFTAETGVEVAYYETIQDNEELFGTIRPDLAAGKPTPYDLIVVTDWMVAKMAALGYLEEIDVAKDAPTFVANAIPSARDPWFDPGNRHSIPWQSGITGIGYNIALTGREITSFDDLLDPAFKGRVGMFSEMRDTMSLALLSLGIVPADATVDDARKAQAKLLEAARRGQFRNFYGNEYTDELASGNLALTIAWGGDVYQLALYDNPDLRFVVPREGGMRWVDNMCIPKGAGHPVDARLFMDFVYRLEVATQISEWIGYFTPVAGVAELIRTHAAKAAAAGDGETATALLVVADTVAPTPQQLASTHPYRNLTVDEERDWNELFNEVLLG